MTLLALGLNHQTAPVHLREQVAFTREQALLALAALKCEPGVTEAAIVSTCNRTELYCTVDAGDAESRLREFLHRHHQLSPTTLDEFLYSYEDEAAVRHLYRVATGLDSLVLGEPQILGQVKEAYHVAREAGALRAPLERLFQSSFAVAKRARTDTRIGANPVSVAFAAVRLTQQVFDLAKSSVLLIGAGDTIELVARHVAEAGVGRMLVANRTLANAQALALRHGAKAMPLDELPRFLHEADVVIASTAARDPLVTREMVSAALKERRHKPMLFLDLAVPRDVDASVAGLDDVYVYTVDDLGGVIEENLRSRREAAREAEAIIDLQVEHFMAWWRALGGTGSLKQLRHDGEAVRDRVLADAQAQLAAGRSPDEVVRFLAHTLTNKLLHAPSANLRAAALRGDQDLLRAAERLFQGASAPDDPSAQ